MKLIRNLSLAAIAMFSLANLSACNTIEGAGKDIKSGGEKIEHEADKANK